MNHLAKKLITILGPGVVLVGLLAAPAFAQNPQAEVRAPSEEAQIKPDQIKVNKRAPMPFQAFDVLDPANRKPISRDTMLPELPNGKRLTAGQYYDEINKLERQFNGLGYTLKNSQEKQIELQRTPVPEATLQQQTQKLRAALLPNTRFLPLNIQAVEQEQRRFAVNPALLGVISRPTNTVNWSKNWNYSVGDSSVFSAYINGNIQLNGTKDLMKIDGAANAGGSIFGSGFDLLRVTADLNAPRTGTMNVKAGVSVVGTNVYNLDQNVTTSWSKSDSVSKTLDKSVTIHFSLGPIPMTAKLGAQGTAGISYSVAVAPVHATASIGPFVHTKAYAQVGVDLVVAGAGAGANLTLLNTDGNLSGTISIEVDPANKPIFKWTDSYSQNLDMLDGKVYVYAYVYVPCWDIPPWCKKEWDWTIFDWTGFKASGSLFSDSKTLDLYTTPVLRQ